MTNKEAISNLEHIYGIMSPDIQRSLDVAFKALEEKPTVSFAINPDYVTELQEHNKELIKQLEEVERSQDKWIPVSERLPSHNEYIKNNGLFNVSDGNRSYSEWFDIYDKQGFGEPTMAGFRVDYAVMAWQPLPKSYKKGGAR